MEKTLLIACFFVFLFSTCRKENFSPPENPPVPVTRTAYLGRYSVHDKCNADGIYGSSLVQYELEITVADSLDNTIWLEDLGGFDDARVMAFVYDDSLYIPDQTMPQYEQTASGTGRRHTDGSLSLFTTFNQIHAGSGVNCT